uniref:Lipase_3 domain-containing protein n=1 Tax=Heterorhabditis bacteriophora TaxID=37862 RepID=A0A1I7XAT5_HETBA
MRIVSHGSITKGSMGFMLFIMFICILVIYMRWQLYNRSLRIADPFFATIAALLKGRHCHDKYNEEECPAIRVVIGRGSMPPIDGWTGSIASHHYYLATRFSSICEYLACTSCHPPAIDLINQDVNDFQNHDFVYLAAHYVIINTISFVKYCQIWTTIYLPNFALKPLEIRSTTSYDLR